MRWPAVATPRGCGKVVRRGLEWIVEPWLGRGLCFRQGCVEVITVSRAAGRNFSESGFQIC